MYAPILHRPGLGGRGRADEKAADDFSGRARGFLHQLANHDRGDRAALSEVRAMMMSDLESRVSRRRCHRDGAVYSALRDGAIGDRRSAV